MKNRDSWIIQKSVVFALLFREIKTRFGEYKLGYLWAIINPVLHISTFILLWSLTGRTAFRDISLPLFLTVSIVPWFCFSDIVSRGMKAVESNKSLFNYHNVKPVDTVISRIILEVLTHLSVFCLIILTLTIIGYNTAIQNLLLFIIAWILLLLFSSGVSLIVGYFANTFKSFEKIVQFVLRLLYFSSAIFYPIDVMPQKARNILLFNPVLQIIELFRASYFESFNLKYVDFIYLIIWSLSLIFIGLMLFYNNRYELIRIK